MLTIFIGFLVGLAIAAPTGPVGVLCIRKTLTYGLTGTLAVGLGTALVDAIYAAIAAFGLASVSTFLLAQVVYFKVFGGILLFGLAFKEYYAKDIILKEQEVTTKGFFNLILTSFLLTFANPMGLISFIGIFAMLGHQLVSIDHAALMVLGVFLGSMGWFLILGRITQHAQHLLPENVIYSIRKVSAIILAAFGAWAFLSLLA